MDWTLTIDSASSSSSSSVSSRKTEDKLRESEKVYVPEAEGEEEAEHVDLEELFEEETNFDASFTPFSLRWSYGRNVLVPFVNLTCENHKKIFYTAAHVGVLYDYENKIMKFLQGHKNCITSIASDSSGKWLVTADAGEDSVIIVWNSENCLPTCTIFDPHGGDGTRLVGLSPDSTYLVSVSDAKDQVVACWKWTLGEQEPSGVYKVPSNTGKIHHITFCEGKCSYFMLTTELFVLFGTWDKDQLSMHVQERSKHVGKLCCSVFQNFSHYALTATDIGTLLMWSDVPFSSVYNNEIPHSNNKTLLKTLKLDKESIQVIKTHREIIVTGNASGELRFYDKMIRILYWVQSFHLNSITSIYFHLCYGSEDLPMKEGSCIISDTLDPFKPFTALEKAFEKVLEKEKEKLADLKLLLKHQVKPKKVEEDEHHDEALINDVVNNVLKDVEQWDIEDTDDKTQFIEKIVNACVDHVENKLSSALNHTEELIGDFIDSVFKEVEDVPENNAKDIAHTIINEIVHSFDASSPESSSAEIIIRDILDKVVDSVAIVDSVIDEIDSVKDESLTSLTELVVDRVFQKIEDKFAIDMQNIVESLVRNLVKDFEEKHKPMKDTSFDTKEEKFKDISFDTKIYCRLKKIIDRGVEESINLRVPSDASLERKPFVIGDFMISTTDGDIGLVNFLNNTYTVIIDKCVSPITSLDCHVTKQQFAVGNATGSVILYNFLKSRSKILEVHVRPKGENCGVTSLKFASSGFYLVCGMEDGSLNILDSSILTPLLKVHHNHVNAPITQICISDDSLWIAHRDDGMRVCLYKCDDPSGFDIEFMGKQKSHFKPIRDLMFMRSQEGELHLYSLGEDRMLVEYDLAHSEPDDLKILLIERIEQSAIPYCMSMYPKFGVENFILIANSEYKFKILNDDSRMCRKTALGPRFEKPVSKFLILPKSTEKSNQYMVYSCEKHIGIQMLPLDGNPYKSVGMIGHPFKIAHMDVYPHSKILFTVGQDDHATFMWTINTRAVNIMAHIGGEGLNPYYCLIEGGQNGWLYKEIQDFFYYAQILHEGENTMTERNVSHEIPLCEVPDLMRAIGYFPSEHEIGNMLYEIQFWTYTDNGKPQKYITFEDFVKLYINHQPAFGTPFNKLRESIDVFADEDGVDGPIMWRETLITMLQERAECLSQEQVVKYLQVLIPSNKGAKSGSSSSSSGKSSSSDDSMWNFLPEEISYKVFVEEILGISQTDKEQDLLLLKDGFKAKKLKDTEEEEGHIEEEEEDKTEEEDECIDDFD